MTGHPYIATMLVAFVLTFILNAIFDPKDGVSLGCLSMMSCLFSVLYSWLGHLVAGVP